MLWISDTIETYFDSRMDLLERTLKKQRDKLKKRAEYALKNAKTPTSDIAKTRGDIERELQKFKLKVGPLDPHLTILNDVFGVH